MKSSLGTKPCLLALCVVFLLLAGGCISTLVGQGLTGQISGTISDPSGAAVADADVQVTNTETGQTRSAKSDNQGYFVFTQLLPGKFMLTITAPGFKKYEQPEISVTATE